MNGVELREWRKKNKYRKQEFLQKELGIKSRSTISAWENSEKPLPRILELALIALEEKPEIRVWHGVES